MVQFEMLDRQRTTYLNLMTSLQICSHLPCRSSSDPAGQVPTCTAELEIRRTQLRRGREYLKMSSYSQSQRQSPAQIKTTCTPLWLVLADITTETDVEVTQSRPVNEWQGGQLAQQPTKIYPSLECYITPAFKCKQVGKMEYSLTFCTSKNENARFS